MKLATSAEMREMDNIAINQEGIPSTTLMMNAAAQIIKTAKVVMGNNRKAAIFSGSGNNGGDGVAAALLLYKQNYTIRLFLVGGRERMSEDTREMERRLKELGGAVEVFNPTDKEIVTYVNSCGVIIDAIFGIGLNTDLRGKPLAAVKLINRSDAPVVSADIASGIEADTGRELRASVKADYTVTFTLPKPGNFVGKGGINAGKVRVADIGIPQKLVSRVRSQSYVIARDNISLPKRRRDTHKGDCGKLLLIGGSVGYTGALTLAARAALRSGAGLVSMGVPESIYAVTATANLESMPFPLPCTGGLLNRRALSPILERMASCDAVLIGPGLGRSDETRELVCQIIRSSKIPIILDADGINAVSGNIDVLDEASAPLILTPHEVEFSRLGGDITHGHRLDAARAFAIRHKVTLVLKGPGTISAFPEGTACVNTTGNPGMSTGGSGDVLAGILTAFVAAGLPLSRAVYSAVWVHGCAGDLAAEKLGQYSMLPSDIIDALPQVLKKIVR